MNLFSFIKKKQSFPLSVLPVTTDIHSHLVPAIDDGIQTIEEGISVLKALETLGYKKVVTTPHTMPGSFDNTPETINTGLAKMQKAARETGLTIEMEAATEYYLDDVFMQDLKEDKPLMTFGNNYVLIETGFMEMPPFLKEATFMLSVKGYKPVYAHPERYPYLAQQSALLEEMIDREVIFQLNIGSLAGAYGKPVQKFAEKLVDMGVVKMIGTDCHNIGHIDFIKAATQTKHFQKLLQSELLNNTL